MVFQIAPQAFLNGIRKLLLFQIEKSGFSDGFHAVSGFRIGVWDFVHQLVYIIMFPDISAADGKIQIKNIGEIRNPHIHMSLTLRIPDRSVAKKAMEGAVGNRFCSELGRRYVKHGMDRILFLDTEVIQLIRIPDDFRMQQLFAG